jgi:hypothetical protein
MKIKNRKRLNFLIAAFLVVFLTGGTFAFVAAGPLLFQGTANVDAELEISIMQAGMTSHSNLPAAVGGNATNLPNGAIRLNQHLLSKGTHQVAFELDFTAPGQFAHFFYNIQNTGTMDAEVYRVKLELFEIDGKPAAEHPDFEVLNQLAGISDNNDGVVTGLAFDVSSVNWFGGIGELNSAQHDNVLEPGRMRSMWFNMKLNPIPEEFGMSALQNNFTYLLTLEYGLPR